MGIKIKLFGVYIFLLLVILALVAFPSIVSADKPSRMLITEVKTGGVIAGKSTEFVEIINDSAQNINLEGWMIEYAKPSAKINDCQIQNWTIQDSSTNVKEYLLSGEVMASQKLIIEISLNDNVGGSLRLSNNGVVFDLVGWGNAISQGVCSEGQLAPLPVNAKSIRRLVLNDGEFVDTNNNSIDFTVAESNVIDSLPSTAQDPQADVCSNFDGIQNFVPPSYTLKDGLCVQISNLPILEQCQGVVLSEILPNPAGEDAGNEYIELHNTTDKEINLAECSIKIGSSIKKLNGILLPGYQAIYGIVLPNASGGSVELITGTTEEVVNYPLDLKDNQAWALINGQWQITDRPTPGTENTAYINTEEATVSKASTSTVLEDCPVGKYRNPETNRCKNIELNDSQKPCEPGQMRNPETNRCKKTAEVLTSLKPCEAGQERNPATNRCRKISSKVALASCKEGQERNPDTNRCRKVASVSTSSPNSNLEQDVKQKQNISYGIFGAMAVFVLSYGVYEYRSNIANFFAKLKK